MSIGVIFGTIDAMQRTLYTRTNKGASFTMRTVHRFMILLVIFALLVVPMAAAMAQEGEGATPEAPTTTTEESTETESAEGEEVESTEGEEAEGEEAESTEGETTEGEEAEEENSIPQGISLLIFLLGLVGVGIVGLVALRSGATDTTNTPSE